MEPVDQHCQQPLPPANEQFARAHATFDRPMRVAADSAHPHEYAPRLRSLSTDIAERAPVACNEEGCASIQQLLVESHATLTTSITYTGMTEERQESMRAMHMQQRLRLLAAIVHALRDDLQASWRRGVKVSVVLREMVIDACRLMSTDNRSA